MGMILRVGMIATVRVGLRPARVAHLRVDQRGAVEKHDDRRCRAAVDGVHARGARFVLECLDNHALLDGETLPE